jgi:hypothetical protein
MVLRPPVRTYAGRPPEQRVLYWERISDVDGMTTLTLVRTSALVRDTCTAADPHAAAGTVRGDGDAPRCILFRGAEGDRRLQHSAQVQLLMRRVQLRCCRLVTRALANSHPRRPSADQRHDIQYAFEGNIS